jgi:HEPN domain-containing protein
MDILIGLGAKMQNKSLASDYIQRAGHRLEAIKVLLKRESYADVVRESQEAVELCLKALLRIARVEVPRIHDVSDVLQKTEDNLPQEIRPHLTKLCQISRSMRRDRELSFYGSEDLTPSEFYHEDDARQALKDAQWVHTIVDKLRG